MNTLESTLKREAKVGGALGHWWRPWCTVQSCVMFHSCNWIKSSVKFWQRLHLGNEYLTVWSHPANATFEAVNIDFAPFLWQGRVIFKFLHSSWLQVELGRGDVIFLWDFDMKRKLVIYLYNKLGSKKKVYFRLGIPNVGCGFLFLFF